MKKIYQTPSVTITRIALTQMLAASVTGTDGNGDFNYGGGGNGPARIKRQSGWDIWGDEADENEWD